MPPTPSDLRIPRRLIVGDRLELPCHGDPGRYGMPIPVSMLDDEAALLLIREELTGGWERQERDLLDQVLGPGRIFVDVGAHWGIHSLHAATAGADVVAVEPDPANLAMLRGWLAANRLQDRVTVVEAAAADNEGTAYLRRNTTMGHATVPGPVDPQAVFRSGRFAGQPVYAPVGTIRLDGLRLPGDGPVVMKVDVEGGEPAALRGAAGLLAAGRVSHILWEINGNLDTVGEQLAGYGFRTAAINAENAVSVRA